MDNINAQVEEGSVATDYEPYIPSVKMLADKVSAQNESLEDYGLDNKFDGIWYQAYRDSATSIVSNNANVCSNVFRCNAGDVVKLNYSNSNQTIYLQFWKSDGSSLSEQSIVGNKLELVAPQDASYVSIDISDIGITPQNVGNVTLYIANEIEQLKNDLDKLNSLPIGSIIQIEAAKDNIETTEQKYGWQYLGTSNIECNDGSVKLLVTNVYRKNN